MARFFIKCVAEEKQLSKFRRTQWKHSTMLGFIKYQKLFLRGISKVRDLMKEPCNFLCLEDFIELYKMQVQPLKFYGLISALKHHYNKNFPKDSRTVSVKPDSFLDSFLKSSKGNKVVYKKLVSLNPLLPKSANWHTIP